MTKHLTSIIILLICFTTLTDVWAEDDESIGKKAFEKACASCHGETPIPRAMSREQLAKLPPEKIYSALTEGLMLLQASALNNLEHRAISLYLSDTEWGTVEKVTPEDKVVFCESELALPATALEEKPSWIGWGLDLDATRYQPLKHSHLTETDLANLELKWAFGFEGAITVTVQPAVVGEVIFFGSPNGDLYAFNRKSGCAYWKAETKAYIRAAIIVAPRENGRLTVYAGDNEAWLYAFDAQTGEMIWETLTDDHAYARITSSPVLHEGNLYFGLASFEELAGGSATYECCTFRGSIVSYAAETGNLNWKSHIIQEEPKKTKKMTTGVQLWGPSGAAVWSQPTIDPKAGVLYATTGDSYSAPAADTSDAIVAMDLETGEHKWFVQTTADDAFTTACTAPNADPVAVEECGPDVDFGSSAIIRDLPNGKRVLLAGQKSGVLHALDPDDNGKILWQKRLSPGGVLGGIEWGFVADDKYAYVPISDVWETTSMPGHAGGIYAVDFSNGKELWNTPAPTPDCLDIPGCNAGQPAAATLLDDVILSASMDGHMRAYNKKSGAIVWDIDTKGEYQTVNGVKAQGGSIKGAGPTVVGGWVYFSSGYGLFGMPGNVFLAYGPK